jgi:ABC-2 type transport system permease protein
VIRLVAHETRYDLLAFARNRQARFFTLLLPVIFLVIFVSVFGNQHVGPEHVKASTYYVPGIAALAVLTASFSNLVISVVTQRELGVLRRRRATPVPAWVIIAGRAITGVLVGAVVTAVVILIGVAAYGVHLSVSALPALALAVAVGSVAFACLGYATSCVVGSADAAQPAVLAITLPLAFISGVYIPFVRLPSALQHVAQLFPLQHLVAALGRGFLPGTTGIAWTDLLVLAGWGPPDWRWRSRASAGRPRQRGPDHNHDTRSDDMPMIVNETRVRRGTCGTHGSVNGEKQVPKVKFPFFITGVARGLASLRPYRCPDCGAKLS